MNKIKEFKINEIPLRYRVCFFASLIWGFLAHGFMLANKLSYHDDINNFGVGATFHFGRWMLSVFGVSSRVLFGASNFSLPWFSGIICILVLAFAACYIIKIFDIKKPLLCVAVAGIIVAFPSITAVFGFMFFGFMPFDGIPADQAVEPVIRSCPVQFSVWQVPSPFVDSILHGCKVFGFGC